MNILFLTTHANTGGITSYLLTLGNALVKSGHKVIVVSSGGDCVPLFEKIGVKHLSVNLKTKSEVHPKLVVSLPVLNRLIQKENIHIIHAQTRVTQVLGSVLSRLSGIKMVTTCHGFFRPRWFRKMFPCWGAAVIAVSRPVATHLSVDFKVPQDRIYLISNGIDLDCFVMSDEKQRRSVRQEWVISDVPLIGIIARLSDVKGIDVLIKAMPLVLKEVPSANLMIIGQGPEEDHLRELAHDLISSGHVQFRSTINETHRVLSAFDVFVMPSLMEGLGLSVMEAQACGIPVVASRVGGLIDLIEDGRTGFLVESRDEKALADRIVQVLQDPQQGKNMAREARKNIEQNFSSEVMLNKTLEVYEQYSGR